MLYDTLYQAFQNVWSNKFRAILTMLGIVIGVTAVMVIAGLGSGMAAAMKDSFSSMGTNLLTVSIFGRGQRNASVEEILAIGQARPDLFSAVSPVVSLNGEVRAGAVKLRRTTVTGVSEEYLGLQSYRVAQGRGLVYADLLDRKMVCVIGDYLSRTAYGGNPLGQTIKVGPHAFTIVGVLAPKVTQTAYQEGSTDDCICLPYTAALRLSRQTTAPAYTVVLADEGQAPAAKAFFEAELYRIFRSPSSYYVTSLSELLQTATRTIDMVVGVLTAIAGISLLVGGIGIMNIMMVTVSERTREIGVRKALGAREGLILWMFVVEAAATSALGGAVGILLGLLLSAGANLFLPSLLPGMALSIRPTFQSGASAFLISAGIGVLFGYLPARHAARLNPIQALRHD